jgi:hypothetical protein
LLSAIMTHGKRGRTIAWIVAVALLLPVLAEATLWSLWRQNLQDSVDHASEAAARALRAGQPVEPAALAVLRPDRLALSAPAAIEHPPQDGHYRGQRNAARIRVTAVRTPVFLSSLIAPRQITAASTAAVISTDRPGETRVARVE